jgi:hypothetical protein
MKHAKKLFCAALALIMALSLAAMPAFAESPEPDDGDDGDTTPTTTNLTKYTSLPIGMVLKLNEGVDPDYLDSIPLFKTTVTLTQGTAHTKDPTVEGDVDLIAGPLPSTDGTTNGAWAAKVWTYDADHDYDWEPKETTDPESNETTTDYYYDDATETQTFDFRNVTFGDVGNYAYVLTVSHDSLSTYDGASLSFLGDNGATDTYKVEVTVLRDESDNSLYISQILVKDKDGKKVYTSGKETAVPLNETLNFVMLTITNEVVGDGSNYDDVFNYWIKIPALGDTDNGIELAAGDKIKGYKTFREDEKKDDEPFEVVVGEDGAYFTLKEDESVVLVVPDTMIFTVTQKNEDLTTSADTEDNTPIANGTALLTTDIDNKAPEGYSTTHEYRKEIHDEEANSTIYTVVTCNATADNNATSDKLNHEGKIYNIDDNLVHFINTKDVTAATGVTLDIIPYVMVVAAAAALAVLSIAKKKKTDW